MKLATVMKKRGNLVFVGLSRLDIASMGCTPDRLGSIMFWIQIQSVWLGPIMRIEFTVVVCDFHTNTLHLPRDRVGLLEAVIIAAHALQWKVWSRSDLQENRRIL